MVKNYMEVLVMECMDDLFKAYPQYASLKDSEKCVDDIQAIALNNIHPFYVTGKKGEVYGKFSGLAKQSRADILAEIVKAADRVYRNRHDESEDAK